MKQEPEPKAHREGPGTADWSNLPAARVLGEAIQAVPQVKYALGVAGIVAAVAIVRSFGLDLRIAAFGAVVTLVLMACLVIFAKLSRLAPPHFVAPALAMVWACLVLVISTAVLLFCSVFFKKPIDLQDWLTPHRDFASTVSKQAAGGVLKVAYFAQPAPPKKVGARPCLEFGIAARRKNETKFSFIQDGDSLASGVDDYCIVGRAVSDGYLYVFQVDSCGKAEWLFPSNKQSKFSAGSNPLNADQSFQIPSAESEGFLYLDENPGVEHIYAIFSASRWTELEAALTKAEPTVLGTTIQKPNGLGLRGVGGIRVSPGLGAAAPIEFKHQGESVALPLLVGALESTNHYLVTERWFGHIAP
jgi:hypothetical protein